MISSNWCSHPKLAQIIQFESNQIFIRLKSAIGKHVRPAHNNNNNISNNRCGGWVVLWSRTTSTRADATNERAPRIIINIGIIYCWFQHKAQIQCGHSQRSDTARNSANPILRWSMHFFSRTSSTSLFIYSMIRCRFCEVQWIYS